MAEVTIRAATPDDVDGILRVAERGWNAAYDDSLSQETIDTAVSEWYDADAIRELVGREGRGVLHRGGRRLDRSQ